MDAAMFGTPGGTRAAEEDQRLNAQSQVAMLLHGVQAQEVLGKIAMQPAANDLTLAHARYYKAAAAEHEAKSEELRTMSALGREAATTPAGAVGSDDEDASLAVPLEKLYRLATDKGMVASPMVQKLATQAASIRQREESAARANAMAAEHRYKAAKQQLDLVGSFAMSATDQASYDRMRLAVEEKGLDLGPLPASFEEAKPHLADIITQSMEAKDVLAAKQKALVDKANIKKLEMQASASDAAAIASTARARVSNQTFEARAKNDGENSPATKALKEARAANARDAIAKRGQMTAAQQAAVDARIAARAAADAKKFDPLTATELADPAKRTVGKTYSTPKGAMIWTKEGWTPLYPLPTIPAINESDDEEDDD